MPPQNPLTRIEQVARDLARLAEDIEPYAGADAKRTLLYWRDELLTAITQLTNPPSRRAAD
jgi:hypothetical protein